MSIAASVQEYVQAMIDPIHGMKVLILDNETVGIISMVFSQSDILQREAFLVERIDAEQKERMRHLNAVCLLRPTSQNFSILARELKDPKYNEYHIFFTNCVPRGRLDMLACCDEYEVVRQVQELYADVYAVNHDVFSLSLPSTARLAHGPPRPANGPPRPGEDGSGRTPREECIFERIVDGLLATCLALRILPATRYTKKSKITQQLALKLQDRIGEEQSLFDPFELERRGEPPVLLLLDRRDDPVTPLLSQWTYQAMIHELLGMDRNRIDMSEVPGIRPELKEIYMSATQDLFFEENFVTNFGDLGVIIKQYVEEYQQQTKDIREIESMQELQRFVDDYPKFKRMSSNVSKHVAVVHELSRLVEANGLLQASQLEQQLACIENRQEQFREVVEMIRGSTIEDAERLRLAMLYALRYEHEDSTTDLKKHLLSRGIPEDQVALVDRIKEYAGSHVRTEDIFYKSLFEKAKSAIGGRFNSVENVYTQHKTPLGGKIDALLRGRLSADSYPFVNGLRSTLPPRVIVFIVGGACFEEARDVNELNKSLESGRNVILGGTTIHNSRSFLADVAQLGESV